MRQHSQKLIFHLLFFLFLSLPVMLSSTVHSDQRTIEGIVTKISKGDTIQVLNVLGREVARGIVNYQSDELARLCGHQSIEIETILGYTYGDEVIHRNNLILL